MRTKENNTTDRRKYSLYNRDPQYDRIQQDIMGFPNNWFRSLTAPSSAGIVTHKELGAGQSRSKGKGYNF